MTAFHQVEEQLPYEAAQLLVRFLQQDITRDDMERLHALLDAEMLERLLASCADKPALQERAAFMRSLDTKAAWRKVRRKQRQKRRLVRTAGTMAALLILAVFVVYRWSGTKQDVENRIVADVTYGHQNDVLPGSSRAELTLSNGKKILLQTDSVQLQEEDGSTLHGRNGSLHYAAGREENAGEDTRYNTLRVPAAGTYAITLPDGTRVWLNAESELTFPLRFKGGERSVTLRGEGFFEVAPDPEHIFRVKTEEQEIVVLGTSFNIDAYHTSRTATTLLSGKVKLHAAGKETVMLPGQLAIAGRQSVRIMAADVEKATAWKNGYFYFSKETLPAIMEQIGRWYGVTVEYNVAVDPTHRYGGTMSRDAKLGEVLDMLKSISGLRYKIEGKNIMISK